MKNHEILLTDHIKQIAEELANRMPDPILQDQSFIWWANEVDEKYQELGSPAGFLKICYKNNPYRAKDGSAEQVERCCRTCEHRFLTMDYCGKIKKDQHIAISICELKLWEGNGNGRKNIS